jgi:hypothetical protein
VSLSNYIHLGSKPSIISTVTGLPSGSLIYHKFQVLSKTPSPKWNKELFMISLKYGGSLKTYGISVISKDPIGIVWLLQTLLSRPADACTWK